METFLHDLRYGIRMLRRSPVFTLIALCSLGLGIGANTAIFTMINVMMLKSMPVKDPGQLALFTYSGTNGDPSLSFSFPLVERFQANTTAFTGVMAAAGGGLVHMTVAGAGDQSDLVRPDRVTGNFFQVLGINPILGRVITEDDDRKYDAHSVVVISYNFWKRRFGLDPSVIGKAITLNDNPYTIVGVTPSGFTGMEIGGNPDMWYPVWMIDQTPAGIANRQNSSMIQKISWWLRIIGRVKPGVSMSQAQSEMDGVFQQMLNEIAETRSKNWTASDKNKFFSQKMALQPGGGGYSYIRFRFIKPLYILMIIVGLVLLIACANVANLLLARAATRQKEIAVRLSIGANRFRLIRQLLTESMMLSIIGGALGLLLSRLFTGLLANYVTNGATQFSYDVNPDLHVLEFTIAVSLITGILFGLAPALRATGFDLVPALKDTTGNLRIGGGRIALDKILVVVQVALSLFLLIGAGLFVRSLQKLKNVDTGFDAENVVIFDLNIRPGYKPAQIAALTRQLLDKLETLPGSRSASATEFTPLSGSSMSFGTTIPGYTPSPDDNMSSHVMRVGPRYFETMGIPVLLGRDFNRKDDVDPNASANNANPTTQPVQPAVEKRPKPAIINQTMANFFWKGENPIGKRFNGSNDDPGYEIVGVVKDAKYENMREKVDRAFFLPYLMESHGAGTFILRTYNSPAAAIASVQQLVREQDKNAQALNVRTMESVVDSSLIQERFIAQLASFFSLFALLLACIGLYGIMSYGVARRTKEMGIRMALGAQSGKVIWMVMSQSLLLVVIGIVIAIPAAVMSTKFVSNYLFGLTTTDPTTIAMATVVLLGVAALAGYLPARRASRVDPMIALRYE